MIPQLRNKLNNVFSNKIALISLISFILLMLVVFSQLTYTILVYDRIFNGIAVNGQSVSGMTRNELTGYLNTEFQKKSENLEIALKAANKIEKFKYSDIKLKYDVETAVEAAYNIGRKGNFFERIKDIINTSRKGKDIPLSISYDREKVETMIK